MLIQSRAFLTIIESIYCTDRISGKKSFKKFHLIFRAPCV